MNNRKRIGAVVMAVWVAVGAVLATGNGAMSPLTMTTKAKEPAKEDMVRVKADASGSPEKVTVESVLRGVTGTEKIADISTLKDIRNRSGDEEYEEGAGNTILWDNNGEDIRYEGEGEVSDLPFAVKISYYLDGRKQTPEQMAGASGHVKIRFDYENKTDFVPFMFVSAVMLDGDLFRDVEAKNGSVNEFDDMLVAFGYAMPGLKEELKLAEYEVTKDVELPEYVEIEADVTDFQLDFTATIVMNGLFEDMDLKELDDADELTDNMDELKDATKKLVDGMDSLSGGAGEFRTLLAEYVDGAAKVDEGMDGLRQGLADMNNNKDQLKDGAGQVAGGLERLDLALKEIDLSSFAGGMEMPDITPLIQASQAMQADGAVLQEGLTVMGQTMEEMSLAMQTLITAAAEQGVELELPEMSGEDTQTKMAEAIAAAEDLQRQSETLKGAFESFGVSPAGEDPAAGAGTGGAIAEQMGQLTQLVDGIGALAEGSRQVYEGVKLYCDGIGQVTHGAYQLSEGTQSMADAGPELLNGYDTLADGIRKAGDGIRTFDDEAIDKLGDLAGDEFKNVLDALRDLQKADREYASYTGTAEGVKGSVRFLLETEGIE